MKIAYHKQIQQKENNPFWRCANDAYQESLTKELNYNLNLISENISYWLFHGTETQQVFANWLLTIPETNKYGKSDQGDKAGVFNSPLSCLAGAVRKLQKGKPGQADLSKVQITNLKKVLTGLRAFDETMFRDIEWVEATDHNTDLTGMQKLRKKLNPNFKDLFET